jgi:hypothetical protein
MTAAYPGLAFSKGGAQIGHSMGLAKRELAAIHIMAGVRANLDVSRASSWEQMAFHAVEAADALMAALAKGEPQ